MNTLCKIQTATILSTQECVCLLVCVLVCVCVCVHMPVYVDVSEYICVRVYDIRCMHIMYKIYAYINNFSSVFS